MNDTTIAAIATPSGYGGIGIVKISGSEAIRAGTAVFRRKSSPSAPPEHNWQPESRRLYYGHIVDSEENRRIDEVLFVAMRAPASYTGEDVVEIQAHGGSLVLRSILNLLLKQGVSLAGPGDFTRRAYLNGRMDLTQAEAVIDLINARTSSSIELAMEQLDGALTSEIQSLRDALLDILAELEASIDFPEQADSTAGESDIAQRLGKNLLTPVRRLIRQHQERNWLREGFRVAIAGSPNVGKSSLLNCLVNRERAIVTEIPGTTRDLVEDGFIAKGIPVVITDTAGIHEQPDPIERVGIDKALAHIESADLILFVMDASQTFMTAHSNFLNRFQNKPKLLVLNKMDLPERIEIPEKWRDLPTIRVSAKYHLSIDQLKETVGAHAVNMESTEISRIVPNLRQVEALKHCETSLEAAVNGLADNQSAEIVAIDLDQAMDALLEITGEKLGVDILDRVFERFCVGK